MGFKIKEVRNKIGMTQAELAEASDVSRATIAGLESGAITTTSTKTLVKLAKALNCSVEKIFFSTEV
jgi:DNA-binding XRE family transcriptional regulator